MIIGAIMMAFSITKPPANLNSFYWIDLLKLRSRKICFKVYVKNIVNGLVKQKKANYTVRKDFIKRHELRFRS